jgi:Secretion system C-terminal sorting domain
LIGKNGTNIETIGRFPAQFPVTSSWKQKLKLMNKVLQLCLYAIFCGIPFLSSAQINLKIAAIPGETGSYGVYARVCENIMPSGNTITGSGQVTLKLQAGATVSNLASHAGTWSQNATIANPSEAMGFTYVSMGFLVDNPQIIFQPDSETLLFSFKLNGSSATPILLENGVDPFDQLPNSANSNPGNELTVLDFGVQPLGLYTYSGNYTGTSITCEEEPQDTTVINPPIDTTQGGGDTTVIDTTQGGGGDTTVIDTTQGGGGDTTVINPPNDTTEQTSGVHDLAKNSAYFTLYPTPAYEWIMVEFLDADSEGGTIKLITLNGVTIGEIERGRKGDVKLNVSGLPSGLYLISYEKDGQTVQRDKFLKQ